MLTISEAKEKFELKSIANFTIQRVKEHFEKLITPISVFYLKSKNEEAKRALHKTIDSYCEAYFTLLFEDYKQRVDNKTMYFLLSKEEENMTYKPFAGQVDAIADKWAATQQMKELPEMRILLELPFLKNEIKDIENIRDLNGKNKIVKNNNVLYYEMIKDLCPFNAALFMDYMSRKKQLFPDFIPFIPIGNYVIDSYIKNKSQENKAL